MIKVLLVSLGCSKNTVDSEAILHLFSTDDFQFVLNPKEAEIIIINTCGFILDAKEEAIETIFKMSKYDAKLIVVGCLVARYKKELIKEMSEVDLFLDFKDFPLMKEKINELLGKPYLTHSFDIHQRVYSTPSFYGYLKISEGCSNFCSFCAIPYIRGGMVSFDMEKLIVDAKEMIKKGTKEIVVIAQDTGKYGLDLKDDKTNLLELLKRLDELEGIEFIRILYLYPEEISDQLLLFISQSKHILHYFDIPIQHISNKVLKRMNRKDTKESILLLYKKIKELMNDAILRTTLMVGFPGESKEDFQELLEFIGEVKFNHLGVFIFSLEDGTAAAKFKDDVSEEEKKKRKALIMEKQAQISYRLNKSLIGKTFKGIISSIDKNNTYLVRSVYNLEDELDGKVIVKGKDGSSLGEMISFIIKDVSVYDLYAEEI